MPPYRDPYADDNDLDEADLGNNYKEGDELPEEEFESAVEDDEEEEINEDDKGNDDDDADSDKGDGDDAKDDGEEDDSGDDGDIEEVDEADDEDGNVNPKGIPQTRFNEVNDRMKSAEERANRLEALLNQAVTKLAEPTEYEEEEPAPEVTMDIAATEKDILAKAFAGDEDGAVALRLELDAYKEQLWAKKYSQPTDSIDDKVISAIQQSRDQDALGKVVAQTEIDFPVLAKGNENYDQTVVDEINDIWDSLVPKYGVSEAFEKAVVYVTNSKGMSPEGSSTEGDIDTKTKGRKKAAVKKAADTQNRQPPKMRGRGAKDGDLDQVKASKLTDKQLFSMSEKELRLLRGD